MTHHRFVLGIAGAYSAGPAFVVDAARAGAVDEEFIMKLTDVDHASVCRVDRGGLSLYAVAAIQCFLDPARAYSNMLSVCHACVYMFSADKSGLDSDVAADLTPFMQALRAAPGAVPMVASINERGPLVQERLTRGDVRAVLPEGTPVIDVHFGPSTGPDGHQVFLKFIDDVFGALASVQPSI